MTAPVNTKTIRQAVVSRLTGQTAAGSKVYNGRAIPNLLNDLPVITVYTPTVSAQQITPNRTGVPMTFNRTVNLEIQAAVVGSANAADELDDIMTVVKSTLFEDQTWRDLYTNIASYDESSEVNDDGSKVTAFGTLTIELELVVEEYEV